MFNMSIHTHTYIYVCVCVHNYIKMINVGGEVGSILYTTLEM